MGRFLVVRRVQNIETREGGAREVAFGCERVEGHEQIEVEAAEITGVSSTSWTIPMAFSSSTIFTRSWSKKDWLQTRGAKRARGAAI